MDNKEEQYGRSVSESLKDDMDALNDICNMTAIDIINLLKDNLSGATKSPEDFIHLIESAIESYDRGVAESAIELKNLTEAQANDKTIQSVGHKYGMTLNQVVGYLDVCEQLNNDQGLKDCGVVAVPFWFNSQYVELKEINAQLIQESDSLMATIANIKNHVPSSQLESLGIDLPERKSIITGVTQPYIPGVTGARIGDEHLDQDNIYLGNNRSK